MNLNYQFKNPSLHRQALTHRSYINENRQQNIVSNERLEFLGDAVLELWVSNHLFHLLPNHQEGELTSIRAMIVCTDNLASIASDINLGQDILLSKGEEAHGGRTNISILADTFESVLGAIYLDGGQEAVSSVLLEIFSENIKNISNQKVHKDPKSLFQELSQEHYSYTPEYKIIKEDGPDHQKVFTAAVYIDNKQIATGHGSSKQKAEEDAAKNGVKMLKS